MECIKKPRDRPVVYNNAILPYLSADVALAIIALPPSWVATNVNVRAGSFIFLEPKRFFSIESSLKVDKELNREMINMKLRVRKKYVKNNFSDNFWLQLKVLYLFILPWTRYRCIKSQYVHK